MLNAFIGALIIAVPFLGPPSHDRIPIQAMDDQKQCKPNATPGTIYLKNAECTWYLVMICHECVYDQNGTYLSEKSSVCGICIGTRF